MNAHIHIQTASAGDFSGPGKDFFCEETNQMGSTRVKDFYHYMWRWSVNTLIGLERLNIYRASNKCDETLN